MQNYLTTHVLDQSTGLPGDGIRVQLFRCQPERQLLCETMTNSDGRTDTPMLQDAQWQAGVFELVFFAGDYFRARGVALAEPAFLDEVVLRFGLTEQGGHVHVPLLLAPYAYSTYRGS